MRFPPGEVRFVADITVGKAAKWLRILGFDTLFMPRLDEDFLFARLAEGRVLVTRDRRLAVKPGMTNALVLTANDPAEQLVDTLRRLRLTRAVFEAVQRMEEETSGPDTVWPKPLSRCVRCNEPLVEVSRAEVVLEVPDFTWATQGRFQRCPVCRRIYWAGTHRERVLGKLRELGLFPEKRGGTPGG